MQLIKANPSQKLLKKKPKGKNAVLESSVPLIYLTVTLKFIQQSTATHNSMLQGKQFVRTDRNH